MMGNGTTTRKTHTLLALLAVVAMFSLITGCGSDPEPQTDPEATMPGEGGEAVETVPEPVVPESAEPTDTIPAPDYGAMEPAEYGVEDIFFAFDEYDLDDVAMSTLSRNARILKEHSDVVILIEGHCDERGTIEYNLALGEKRAKAVRDYLVSLGVASSRLRVTSYGESKPFAMGSNETAWAKNRRAHFARP
jgi:peptidoglycan-associated lipoprotein